MVTNILNDILKNNDYSKYSVDELKRVIQHCDDAYYNSDKPLMSDEQYDNLREYLINIDPDFEKTGSLPNGNKKKVLLPVWMGSMDKKKSNINEKGELVISDKLDGVSCLFTFINGEYKMFSRGNGEYGTDITSLIPFVNIPKIKYSNDFMIRGELIMKKKIFAKLQTDNAKSLSNARNTVSGIVNSKTPDKMFANLVDCVFYEVIQPNNMKPSKQLKFMRDELNIDNAMIVEHYMKEGTSDSVLRESLVNRKKLSPYEIDGLIVANNVNYKQPSSGNPKHAFAFKELSNNMQSKETEVVKVDWKASKDLFLKPTVHFKEVVIDNIKIKQATGFNAKYICDNKIGKGALIEIVRSGDVIPYINKINKGTIADMPDVKYAWTDTKVDIYIDGDDKSEIYNEKQFIHTTTTLKIDNLGPSNIKKLFDNDITTIKQLFGLSVEKLVESKIFQKKTAENIVAGIRKKKKSLTCLELMAVSNVFGRGLGLKTLETIINEYPINLNNTNDELPSVAKIATVNGVGSKTAEQYLSRLPAFKTFVISNSLSWCEENSKMKKTNIENNSKPNMRSHILEGQKVLFTGFRSPELQQLVIEHGGVIYDSLKKDTTLLVYKSRNKKVEQAESTGITIEEYEHFKQRLSNIEKKNPTPSAAPKEPTPQPTAPKEPTPQPPAPKEPTPQPPAPKEPTPQPPAPKEPTPQPPAPKNTTLIGERIVFTGFRSIQLQNIIKEHGGEIDDKFNKNTTTLLLYKSRNKKVELAESLGIKTDEYKHFTDRITKKNETYETSTETSTNKYKTPEKESKTPMNKSKQSTPVKSKQSSSNEEDNKKRGRKLMDCSQLTKSSCYGRKKHVTKPCKFENGKCVNM